MILKLFEGKQPVLQSHPLETQLCEMQSYHFAYSLTLIGAASVSVDLLLIHSGLSSSILVKAGSMRRSSRRQMIITEGKEINYILHIVLASAFRA